jgi:chemotaxis signal transduction protein
MRTPARSRKAVQSESVILFGLGAITFAIPAREVDEIRDLAGLIPAGVNAPSRNVKSRLVREGKTHWVIDGNEHFRMPASRSTRLLVLRNVPTAVLVDSIDRMAEIAVVLALPHAFQGDERSWYRGLAILQENATARAVPLVNAESFARTATGLGAAVSR